MDHAGINLQTSPYRHQTCDQVFTRACLAAFQDWAQQDRKWLRQEGETYKFWSSAESASLQPITSRYKSEFDRWRSATKENLGLEIPADPSLDMFRFEPGDGIGIHNDAAVGALRLIVAITALESWSQGGAMVLIGASKDQSIVYPAATNQGVCFDTQASHRHAVTTVRNSTLTMLIVQYPITTKS